jgi:hypothetical protein
MATQSPVINRVSCGVSGIYHERSLANTYATQPYPTIFARSNNSSSKARNSTQLLEPCFHSSLKDSNTHLVQSKSNYHALQPSLAKPIGLPGRSYMIPMSSLDDDSTPKDIELFTNVSTPTDYTTLNHTKWDNNGSYSGTYSTMTPDPIRSVFQEQGFSDLGFVPSYDNYPSTEPGPSCIDPYPILGSADGVTHLDLWDQTFHSAPTSDQPFPDFPYLENVSSDSSRSIPYRSCEYTTEFPRLFPRFAVSDFMQGVELRLSIVGQHSTFLTLSPFQNIPHHYNRNSRNHFSSQSLPSLIQTLGMKSIIPFPISPPKYLEDRHSTWIHHQTCHSMATTETLVSYYPTRTFPSLICHQYWKTLGMLTSTYRPYQRWICRQTGLKLRHHKMGMELILRIAMSLR